MKWTDLAEQPPKKSTPLVTKSESDGCWTTFGRLVFYLAVYAPLVVSIRAVVVKSYWQWFLTPATGVDSPAYWLCAGLSGGIAYLTMEGIKKPADDDWGLVAKLFAYGSISAIVYGVGWVIKTYGPSIG